MKTIISRAAAIISLLAALIQGQSAVGGPPNLPTTDVCFSVNLNCPATYASVILSSVPSGYDVGNAAYPGWCVDQDRSINVGQLVCNSLLVSSLDPSANDILNTPNPSPPPSGVPPAGLACSPWSYLNWIINHRDG